MPKPAVTEFDFHAAVLGAAEQLGFRCYRIPDSRKVNKVGKGKGWPDLVLCRPPILIFAELKRDGEEPDDDQMEWLNLLEQCTEVKANWFQVQHYDELLAMLQEALTRG